MPAPLLFNPATLKKIGGAIGKTATVIHTVNQQKKAAQSKAIAPKKPAPKAPAKSTPKPSSPAQAPKPVNVMGLKINKESAIKGATILGLFGLGFAGGYKLSK